MTQLRQMTPDELVTVLDWAAEEGWNPGLDDAPAFFAADPLGFFVAEVAGQPVAAISVVNHTPEFAFLGLYLCRPAYRGRGIGLALWRHAIAHAGARIIGLDGVPDQQDNYLKSGFQRFGATSRYSGRVTGTDMPDCRAATRDDAAQLIALEAAASGVAKPAYLSAWFRDTDTRRSFCLIREGRVAGLATVRQCRDGAKIGPLVAPDAGSARALVQQAAAVFDGPVILDVPATAQVLDTLCQSIGLTPSFSTARMYRGAFAPPAAHCYAVGSLELG